MKDKNGNPIELGDFVNAYAKNGAFVFTGQVSKFGDVSVGVVDSNDDEFSIASELLEVNDEL